MAHQNGMELEQFRAAVENSGGSYNGLREQVRQEMILTRVQQGNVRSRVQVTEQEGSEITGPAFSPDGSRLYFSSQRGAAIFGGGNGLGMTYEIRGPFHQFVSL